MFKRPVYGVIAKRLQEKRRFIQVLSGPRQTGKTTLALQLIDDISAPTHYTSADEPALKSTAWIEQQWETARFKIRQGGLPNGGLLVLDEIHKIPGWSETVKRLWDEDTVQGSPLHVILLGSSPILMQSGLTESLAGRFEVIPVSHWSFVEMKKAFGWGIDRYVYFGGYPGAAELTGDQARWSRYIMDALIETTVSRDVLLMKRVDKPALLRRLFELGCIYSGQILSYQKMLGQLHDAGNTTTLAHYLDLLGSAGLLSGLSKYAGATVRQRGSSPKFQAYNNALMTAQSPLGLIRK
jgi:predicted AAA+ superfamily ATPase